MLLILIFFSLAAAPAWASHDLDLELGEFYPLTQKFSKVWIEDKKSLDIQNKSNRFIIKTFKPGITHFRLDNTLYNVRIMPLGSKKSLNDWQLLKNKFVGVNVTPCGYRNCLTGKLYRLRDYEKIIELIEFHKSKIYLALDVAEELREPLQNLISARLRLTGLTPRKIIFSRPWMILDNARNGPIEEVQKLGLLLQTSEKATDIADNIKVKVKIVEVSRNYERKLGVRWPDSLEAKVLNLSQLNGPDSLDIAINAAEKNGDARILASPDLICRSGKEASFFAGGEFPVKIVHLRSQDVVWKQYGIGLKFKPLIDSVGQMSLQLETEVSTLDRSISVDDLPALHSNRVSSYFDLIESKTIAISGLIKNESSENSEGIPYLKNIPVLGSLFESKNFRENKSKLIIFVTPELFN